MAAPAKCKFQMIPHSSVQYEESWELANATEVKSEEPSQPFDDVKLIPSGQYMFVTGMTIYVRRWDCRPVIGGLKVFYSNGQSALHGGSGYGYEEYEFHLAPGEVIESINARNGWLIDQLQFVTNRGNTFGPYGGPGGLPLTLKGSSRGAFLSYVKGTVDVTQKKTAVRKLRFVWAL